MLAERLGARDRESLVKLLKVAIKIDAWAVLPMVAVGSLLSPVIMGMYGDDFRHDWPTLIVCLATAGAMAIQQPFLVVLMASGRMWSSLLFNVVWGLVFVLTTWTLLDWGSVGIASGQFVASVVQGLCAFAYAYVLLSLIHI